MNVRRIRRGAASLALGLLLAVCAAAIGAAQTDVLKPALCPNPKTGPLGTSLGIRGYLACDDNATATATIAGKLTHYEFPKDGVCWRDSTSRLYVDIGAVVNGGSKRSDPPSFQLLINAKGAFALPSAHVAVWKNSKLIQGDGPVNVKVTWGPKPHGSFSPHKTATSSGRISGSFECEHLLVVPG